MTEEIRHAVSADGTSIGYEVAGSGPALLVLHGMAADRSQWAPLTEPLSERFTVIAPDRRGRGLSSEEATADYALDREAEDLVAVIEHAGAPAFVFAHSYGGLCALRAVAIGDAPFAALLIDETPAGMPGPLMMPADTVDGLEAALAQGGPDAGLAFFLQTIVGLPAEVIEQARSTPMWELRRATVPTVLREAKAANTYQRESAALAEAGYPVRFVYGRESLEPMRLATEAAHADMPRSELVVVDGRLFTSMYADPAAVAAEIGDWFLASAG